MVDHKLISKFCIAMLVAVIASTSNACFAKKTKSTAAAAGPSGKASIYSNKFNGRKTASGERFHQSKLTAASPVLPIGSKVKVTNRKNGKSVVVRINDKQAKKGGRILDLSKAAATKIGVKDGIAPVSTKVLKK